MPANLHRRKKPKPVQWAVDVRLRRIAADLTQHELADIAETSRVSINRIENGLQVPPGNLKDRIDAALRLFEEGS